MRQLNLIGFLFLFLSMISVYIMGYLPGDQIAIAAIGGSSFSIGYMCLVLDNAEKEVD